MPPFPASLLVGPRGFYLLPGAWKSGRDGRLTKLTAFVRHRTTTASGSEEDTLSH